MTANSILGDTGMSRKRVAVLISGRGSNMAALIEAAKDKTYPAEIVLVVSNRPDAGGLATARAAGIATEIVDHTPFGKDRAAFEARCKRCSTKHRIDIVCLAGFMRLLTAGFVDQWPERMLNIHPALLPAFKGLDTHKRALAAGREDSWRHGAFRGGGNRFRPDHRARRGRGARRRHRGDAGRARAQRSSTGFTRRRSGWWRKAACASSTAAA